MVMVNVSGYRKTSSHFIELSPVFFEWSDLFYLLLNSLSQSPQ